jgi:membrane protease YdiL (CAAX protease family)
MSNSSMQDRNWIKRHPVAAYYGVTIVFTWAIQLPLVAVKQGWIDVPIPLWLHYLASFGPTASALVVTAWTTGKRGLTQLWSDVTRWRVGWVWGLFSVLSPVVAFGLSMPIVYLFKGTWPDLRLLGAVSYLPRLGLAVLPLWLLTFGFGEEIGWRGFALPRLQKTMSVTRATLVLGLMWVLWHAPAFFYHETYQGMGWITLLGFVFGVLCGAVLLTWLYNGTRGSVLMAALWHGTFDLLTASKAGQDVIPIVMSALVIAWALLVANVDKPWGFRFQARHTV